MTSSSGSSSAKELNLVDSLDDFLHNMDKEREAINARILAAYGEGGGQMQPQRQFQFNDNNFTEGSHEPSFNSGGNNDQVEEGSMSSSSMLVSLIGENNNDGSTEVQNDSCNSTGAPTLRSVHDRDNMSLKMIHESGNNNSDGSIDNIYNITQQSQQLYDKLNTSYNSHQNDNPEDTPSSSNRGLATIPTMTTYNSSPGGSSYLGTPPPLVVKKVIEEREGVYQQRMQQEEKLMMDQEQSGTILQDVHEAGSKESYDWVLQQLSKKKEVEVDRDDDDDGNMEMTTSNDVTSTVSVTNATKHDDVANSTQRDSAAAAAVAAGWFQRNNKRVSAVLKVNTDRNIANTASSRGDDNILFRLPIENENSSVEPTELPHRGQVVLINPNIFDNNDESGSISLKDHMQVGGGDTSEIANLVAQVSQISSTEDWAKQYQFDDVIGIDSKASNDNGGDSLTTLIYEVVQDSGNTVLFAAGGKKSGKTSMLFGSSISSTIASVSTKNTVNSSSNLGMVGDVIDQVLKINNKCSISILEIADEDVLRDILGFSENGWNEQRGMSALRLRYGDRTLGSGAATVENLWQVPITSFEEANQIICEAFQSRSLRKIWSEEGGHGHFIVTINFSADTGTNESCIQLIDLASPDNQANTSSSSRVGSIRKSLSALRGILRGLATNHSNSSSTSSMPVSFRECTLTKVLQRTLENRDAECHSRAIVIGCVNPTRVDYSQTLRTLDFLTSISTHSGETIPSPLHDGKTFATPGSTPNHYGSDGRTLLKSIVSDPRQRLAKLLTPQSSSKKGDGLHGNNRTISTPRSSSTYSENMAKEHFRSTYTSVFDQLENLMANEEEEDNVDRDNYGNTIIQAITPNPKSNSKQVLSEPSPDTDAEEFFSPLQDMLPSASRNRSVVKRGQRSETKVVDNPKTITEDAAKVDDRPPLLAEIEFERSTPSDERNWNELLTRQGQSNQAIFVEKSKLIPLKTLISHDSMDSELLVSCRNNAWAPRNHQLLEVAAPEPDISTIVESFQQDVEALIKESPGSKISNDGGYSRNKDSDVLMSEVIALKSMLGNLEREKSAADSFIHKLQMIIDGSGCDPVDDHTSFPSNCLSIINSFHSRQVKMESLQRELKDCKAKNVSIMAALKRADTDESFEKDLTQAKDFISDQAKKLSALEAEVQLKNARVKELSSENALSSTQLREIDEKIGTETSSEKDVCDANRQQLRLERVERMRDGLQQLLAKNQKLERLLSESQDEGNKARQAVDLLEAKLSDMQSQVSHSQGANSRAMEAAEKLAEEAVRDNEVLTNEIAALRENVARTQKEYQSLSQQHGVVVAKNRDLSVERERLLTESRSEMVAMRDAFDACKIEKAQLEEQLASFSAKTAEMMTQRIDQMKEDYVKQLSLQQSRAKKLDEEKDAQQMAAISSIKDELLEKQSENENLRLRLDQIEEETSLKVQDKEATLKELREELQRANNEAKYQRDENKSLHNELGNLRGIIDVAEQSVNEVNRLRIENDQLQESIRSQQEQNDTSFEVPIEIRGRSSANNVSFLHDTDEYFMKERITALMRENEQNNISMRSLQSENVALKSSVDQCTGTIDLMRSELNELKSMTSEGMSKMRMRHEKDKVTIADMEKKLERANNFIRKIRPTHGGGGTRRNTIDDMSMTSRWDSPLEAQVPRRYETSFTPYDASETKSTATAAELCAEKELRYKAEEICAGVLADAKLGFEERDKEIERLKSKLARARRYNNL